MAHCDIYREQLGTRYPLLGHALWEPTFVDIGDVGCIRDGKFLRLFNALYPKGHPSNLRFGVPDYHEPLVPRVSDHLDKGILKHSNYCSSGVNVTDEPDSLSTGPDESKVTYSNKSKRGGAVLYLPTDAQRHDTLARRDFGQWIIKHIDNWLAFARRLGLGIEQMEDIVLVTGCHRTWSWANITFLEGHADVQASFRIKAEHRTTGVKWRFSPWGVQGAMCNWGPEEGVTEDQCVFLRGFRVVRMLGILPRQLKGASGLDPSLQGNNDDDEPDRELISLPGSEKPPDPLRFLFNYVTEQAPHCDMALIHDDDLARIARSRDDVENLQPDIFVADLHRSQPEILEIRYDSPSTNEDSCDIGPNTTKVAMFSEEFQGWKESAFHGTGRARPVHIEATGLTLPTVDLGQHDAYQSDKLVIQAQEQPPEQVEDLISRFAVSDVLDVTHSSDTRRVSYPELPTPRATPHHTNDSESCKLDLSSTFGHRSATVTMPPKRWDKARSKREHQGFDHDDYDEALENSVIGSNAPQPSPNRLPGACTYCNRLKMECYFPPGEDVCKRCQSGKHDCVVDGLGLIHNETLVIPPMEDYDLFDLRSSGPYLPPATTLYNGSYHNSPYSAVSELDFDSKDESLGLFNNDLLVIPPTEDYDPSKYDAPSATGLLMFDDDFMSRVNDPNRVSVCITPAEDASSLAYYDQSSPSLFSGSPSESASSAESTIENKPRMNDFLSPFNPIFRPSSSASAIQGRPLRTSSGSRERGIMAGATWGAQRSSPYPISPSSSLARHVEPQPDSSLGSGQTPLIDDMAGGEVSEGYGRGYSSGGSRGATPAVVARPDVTITATAGTSTKGRINNAKFVCPVPGCSSTFIRHFKLKEHLRSHNDEKPFQCKWPGCGKGFARHHDCKRHEQLHSNHHPFICDGCRKPFARLDALNRHLRSEGGSGCLKAQELSPEQQGPLKIKPDIDAGKSELQ